MLLLSVVYDNSREDIVDGLNDMIEYFKSKNITIGLSESIEEKTHFLKIFCEDSDFDIKHINLFNIYIANVLYNVVIDEFYKKEMQSFLTDTYFFLKYDEIKEVKSISLKALKSEGAILDENMVFFINRKNKIVQKIIECIEENQEINVKGFITFRMKELREDLESIIDKVVENYMVEKEYNEFIKLLKYFVDIQESKIDEVNIIVEPGGNYIVRDRDMMDISDKLFSDLSEARFSGAVNIEDMLISGLITNAPNKVVIHCADNCTNKELIDTIKNVFLDRVEFCTKCKVCKSIKPTLKV